MEAIELRKKADKLQKNVKILVEQFIRDVGECDIDITIESEFVQEISGKNQRVNTDVKVNVTV